MPPLAGVPVRRPVTSRHIASHRTGTIRIGAILGRPRWVSLSTPPKGVAMSAGPTTPSASRPAAAVPHAPSEETQVNRVDVAVKASPAPPRPTSRMRSAARCGGRSAACGGQGFDGLSQSGYWPTEADGSLAATPASCDTARLTSLGRGRCGPAPHRRLIRSRSSVALPLRKAPEMRATIARRTTIHGSSNRTAAPP